MTTAERTVPRRDRAGGSLALILIKLITLNALFAVLIFFSLAAPNVL